MFGNGTQKAELPLIIVCDDKDMVNANYLIQLIGQKDDAEDSVVGIEDGSVSAAIYTTKNYKDNLPQIPSTQHILFIGQSSVAQEQSKTIPEVFSKLGMHYGWLGKRSVLYVDDTSGDWSKAKENEEHYSEFLQFSKDRGMNHAVALPEYRNNDINQKSKAATAVGVGAGLAAVGAALAGVGAALIGVGAVAGKKFLDHKKVATEIKAQQYRTLIKVFYEDGLRTFMEG